MYKGFISIVFRQQLPYFPGAGIFVQSPGSQRKGYCHSIIITGHYRQEYGRMLQTRHMHHFRQMLMLQSQTVGFWTSEVILIFQSFIFSYQFPASPAVAGDRGAADRIILWQDSCFYQRIDRKNESGCMAAWVSDSRSISDSFSLSFAQLRKSVYPAAVCAMSCTGINHFGMIVFNQSSSFPCRSIRQAEKNQIRFI